MSQRLKAHTGTGHHAATTACVSTAVHVHSLSPCKSGHFSQLSAVLSRWRTRIGLQAPWIKGVQADAPRRQLMYGSRFLHDNLSGLSAPSASREASSAGQGDLNKKHPGLRQGSQGGRGNRVTSAVMFSLHEDTLRAISAFHLGRAFSSTTASHVPFLGWSLLGLEMAA